MQKRFSYGMSPWSVAACRLPLATSRRGFTLLEVTLTIGILTVIFALTLSVSMNAIERSSLQSAENVLVQTLRRAQTLAQQNVQESFWGVYICPEVDPPDGCINVPSSVILYRRTPGNIYATFDAAKDQAFEISRAITVSGTLYDKIIGDTPPKGFTFARLTSKPQENGFQGTIVLTMGDESRTITVSAKGVVEH